MINNNRLIYIIILFDLTIIFSDLIMASQELEGLVLNTYTSKDTVFPADLFLPYCTKERKREGQGGNVLFPCDRSPTRFKS